MPKIISVFNNKGGVGKSTICWNIANSLGQAGKKVLLIDFDPQCNLSLAVLGESQFVDVLPTENIPYGKTIRSYLQRFLQNTGGEEVFLHQGQHTNKNVSLVAGDFWLNVYAESLSVGSDLLTGTGLSRYVAINKLITSAEATSRTNFNYVIVDLPPSFGALVRAAFYSSDYYIVPCTSDNFSVYCVGLIGQMVPDFVHDWETGLARFRAANPHFKDFDNFGMPVFAGWIFNGFDTTRERRTTAEIEQGAPLGEKKLIQADQTMHDHLSDAIRDKLVAILKREITKYNPVANEAQPNYRIGDIEDANVLIQNSLWLNVPLGDLDSHEQVVSLRDRKKWADNQVEQIKLLRSKFAEAANNIIRLCA